MWKNNELLQSFPHMITLYKYIKIVGVLVKHLKEVHNNVLILTINYDLW